MLSRPTGANSSGSRLATELWLRIADIQARLGRPQETIAALERAAQTNLSDDSISSRLSQAYAAAGHATAAQRALEAALAVRPDSDEYLRAHATVATWAGDYDAASSSYRKLRQGHPAESDLTLALARVNVWAGHTDAATRLYRDYLATPDACRRRVARARACRGMAREFCRGAGAAARIPHPRWRNGRLRSRAGGDARARWSATSGAALSGTHPGAIAGRLRARALTHDRAYQHRPAGRRQHYSDRCRRPAARSSGNG